MSCECCWHGRSLFDPLDEAYQRTLQKHEARGCVCTKNTMAGLKERAGQFWDEGLQRDRRYEIRAWAVLVAGCEENQEKPFGPGEEPASGV